MFIRSLKLRNILSFREPPPLELRPLNILIGPNASGKSNLIDCIGLLQALPGNVSQYINDRGAADSWIWRGTKSSGTAELNCSFEVEDEQLEYLLEFSSAARVLSVDTERLIEGSKRRACLLRRNGTLRVLDHVTRQAEIPPTESALAAYRNPLGPTSIARTQREFNDIRIYRGFDTGTRADARMGVSSSGPKLPLESDGSNLALALHQLGFHDSLKNVEGYLSRLSSRFKEIKLAAEGARMQLYLEERGLGKISATRLSDGTLRFLCLMAILFDPKPAPLVCIEEPEIGLHPEALALVGDALREASQRMQLVVTTHSDALVDRFTDEPDQIVVCERDFDESTCVRRLSSRELRGWLKEYTLGDLWRRGGIGGAQS